MSIIDTIYSMNTGDYLVTRHVTGTMTNGIYTPAAPTTLTITAVLEPASGFQRVVGGKDFRSNVDGEHVDEVRVAYTDTELLTRTPTNDPDYVTIDGAQWLAMRVERWEYFGDVYWRVVLTKETFGGS